MGFFDIFGGGPFDFNGDGRTDTSELALGLMMMDEIERERKKQELVSDLLRNAALSGLTYSEAEIQDFLTDAERNGLLD